MKILYHHRTMGRGAEGIHIASIVKAFEKLGHKVIIVSPPGMNHLSDMGQAPLDKSEKKVRGLNALWKMISKNAPQVFFELLEIMYNISAIAQMKKILKKHKIDFIYERNAYFLFAGAYVSRKNGIPLAVEANEVVGIKRARGLVLKRLAAFIEKYTFLKSKGIFVVSSFLKNRVKKIVREQVKVQVIPNGIDPILFSKNTGRDKIRKQYNISDKTVLGFVGWFDWWDRLDLLLEIQRSLMDSGYHDIATVLIGDGPVMSDLQKKTRELRIENEVIFTGPVERKDVIDYMDAIDIGILPNSNEFGSPVVLFEMMGLGKPVVAPSLLPINDVILHNDNGMLFPPLDKNELEKNICTLVENPDVGMRIGKRASETVQERHTWVGNAKKIMEIMEIKTSKTSGRCDERPQKLNAVA